MSIFYRHHLTTKNITDMSLYKLLLIVFGSIAFMSCQKEDTTNTTNIIFSAKEQSIYHSFTDIIEAKSEKTGQDGNYILRILGTKKITDTTSIQIRFAVIDFTRDSSQRSKTYTLNKDFAGHFVEITQKGNDAVAKYHYFKEGNLTLYHMGEDIIQGDFSFNYQITNNAGEVIGVKQITEGILKNIKIKRSN